MSDFSDFINIMFETRDKKLLEDFLLGVTTPRERKELAMRVNIVNRLIEGIPQQKIARDLGVGVSTVSRGSKELSQGRFKVLKV